MMECRKGTENGGTVQLLYGINDGYFPRKCGHRSYELCELEEVALTQYVCMAGTNVAASYPSTSIKKKAK